MGKKKEMLAGYAISKIKGFLIISKYLDEFLLRMSYGLAVVQLSISALNNFNL
jgi:hypothetical protein